jgi:hypothetical protein
MQAIQDEIEKLRREAKQQSQCGNNDVALLLDEIIQIAEVYLLSEVLRGQERAKAN